MTAPKVCAVVGCGEEGHLHVHDQRGTKRGLQVFHRTWRMAVRIAPAIPAHRVTRACDDLSCQDVNDGYDFGCPECRKYFLAGDERLIGEPYP